MEESCCWTSHECADGITKRQSSREYGTDRYVMCLHTGTDQEVVSNCCSLQREQIVHVTQPTQFSSICTYMNQSVYKSPWKKMILQTQINSNYVCFWLNEWEGREKVPLSFSSLFKKKISRILIWQSINHNNPACCVLPHGLLQLDCGWVAWPQRTLRPKNSRESFRWLGAQATSLSEC